MTAVFLFEHGGDLQVFASLKQAAGYMEAVDVDAGEYADAFLEDGSVLTMSTVNEMVVLTLTARRDLPRLHLLLKEYLQTVGAQDSAVDPHEFAETWLHRGPNPR